MPRAPWLDEPISGSGRIRHLTCEVGTRSKPRPGPRRHTYECDVVLRITEDGLVDEQEAILTVHHPRGWMGVEAEFDFDVEESDYPTFEERAEYVRRRVVEEFPPDEIISVFLLGTGDPTYEEGDR